jgi:hypothetical protein
MANGICSIAFQLYSECILIAFYYSGHLDILLLVSISNRTDRKDK